MSETVCQNGTTRNYKWYQHWRFALIPLITKREGDECNTKSFTFRWLFLTFWTLDIPSLAIEFVCCSHWGLGFIGLLPYIRWSLTIPLPRKFQNIEKVLHRKPKKVL
jgi:hypothetical protein